MEMKKVSVIIPVYNVASYLRRCINSILNQSFRNIEIILIDDGSNDGSELICDEYGVLDNTVVIHQKNAGVSKARNAGIVNSTGDYVLFVDADDFVATDYIQTLIEGMEESDISVVSYALVDCDTEEQIEHNQELSPGHFDNYYLINHILDENMYKGYLWNKMFKLSVIRQNDIRFLNNIKIWEDLTFCIDYLCCITSGIISSKCPYYYCYRKDSAVNNSDSEKDISKILALEHIYYTICDDSHVLIRKRIASNYSNMLLSILYNPQYYQQYLEMGGNKDICSTVSSFLTYLDSKHILFYYLCRIPFLASIIRKVRMVIKI